MGISVSGQPGRIIGAQTLDSILLNLEHNPQSTEDNLQALRDKNLPPSYLIDMSIDDQKTIITALKYLYPDNISLAEEITATDPTTNLKLIVQANRVLETYFGGTLIGSKVLGDIFTKFEGKPF